MENAYHAIALIPEVHQKEALVAAKAEVVNREVRAAANKIACIT